MYAKLWNQTPPDIIQRILAYDTRLKLRAGKWMTQIPETDARYQVLLTIPPKYNYCISPTNKLDAYRETYVIFPNKKYLMCRIENDFYFPKHLVLQYFYVYTREYDAEDAEYHTNRSYVIHTMPLGGDAVAVAADL